jgi:beta-alanine degradation protein BauB
MRPRCTAWLVVDDDRVRVTRFDFAPRAETGWHRHRHDYVIVAVTDCPMLLEKPGGGVRRVLVPKGTAYRRAEGVEHNVVNDGAEAMSFVEVELKGQRASAVKLASLSDQSCWAKLCLMWSANTWPADPVSAPFSNLR